MPPKPKGRLVYVPIDSFVTDIDGTPATFTKNVTRVREGHPILSRFPELFEPMRVHYEWEQATEAPGETRA